MDPFSQLKITPISKDIKSESYIHYQEQILRTINKNTDWCWDDSDDNDSKVNEYFVFYFHKIKVVIHKIIDIKPPSFRLPSWTNSSHSNRNVLILSNPLITINWKEWKSLDGPLSYMGTYTAKNLLAKRPKLYEFIKNLSIPPEDSLEEEEKILLIKLEKIQKLKKIKQLQSEKNNLLIELTKINSLIDNIDQQIQELS
jgi:hypothetical protein